MKKNILSLLITIVLVSAVNYALKGERTNSKFLCHSKIVNEIFDKQEEIFPYYSFFIKL